MSSESLLCWRCLRSFWWHDRQTGETEKQASSTSAGWSKPWRKWGWRYQPLSLCLSLSLCLCLCLSVSLSLSLSPLIFKWALEALTSSALHTMQLHIIWWIKFFIETFQKQEPFVEIVINQMMKFIGPTRRDSLMPHEAVTLYVQFSVLQTFLHYSPKISAFIRNHYLEEFK